MVWAFSRESLSWIGVFFCKSWELFEVSWIMWRSSMFTFSIIVWWLFWPVSFDPSRPREEQVSRYLSFCEELHSFRKHHDCVAISLHAFGKIWIFTWFMNTRSSHPLVYKILTILKYHVCIVEFVDHPILGSFSGSTNPSIHI